MGKTDSKDNQNKTRPEDGATNPAADAPVQAQMTLFETVTAPTMTTENSSPVDKEQVHQDGQEGTPIEVRSDAKAGADDESRPIDAKAHDADIDGADVLVADVKDAEVEDAEVEDAGITGAVVEDQQASEVRMDAVAETAVADNELRIPAIEESLGQRLRAAREARGMQCEEAAHAMRLPLATVQALEADRYERIGEGIYLRSYLSKYLRLLDLPQVLADRVLDQHAELPPLVTSGTISRPRYLFERYSSSALYLILTAVIIVPAVWLAMRAGFDGNLAQVTPLDTPAGVSSAAGSSADASGNSAPQRASNPATPAAQADEPPLVASLAPFPAMKHEAADADPIERASIERASTAAASAAKPGEHTLRLALAEASWVEIVASDGEKLEFGLLGPGTVRIYHSAKSIDVRLGNVVGASVEIDGKAQDLTAFRHANVARFRLGAGETSISHSGG